jgi:hypothetical protein
MLYVGFNIQDVAAVRPGSGFIREHAQTSLPHDIMLLRGHYVARLLIALCLTGVPLTNGFEISGGSFIDECHTVDFFVAFKCRKLVWHVE